MNRTLKPYKAAVIGCGRIGAIMERDVKRLKPATHAGSFAASPLTELCALVDSSPEQLAMAQAIFPGTPAFANVKSMLETCRPDIVSVATPPDQHYQAVAECAGFGVAAIVCEKPIALIKEEAEAMINVCRDNGSLLFINHTRRFDSLLRDVRRRIERGDLGIIHQANGYYTAGLFNTGTHLVDLLRFLTGKEVKWVSALPENRFTIPAGDINVNSWLMLQDDLPVSLQALEVKDYAIFSVYLYGSKGALVIDRFGFSFSWSKVIDCYDFDGYQELDVFGSKREGASRSFFLDMVQHIVDCLEGRAKPISSGQDGLTVLNTLAALKESALSGGERIYLVKELSDE